MGDGVLDGLYAAVQCMVVGHGNDIDPGILHGIAEFGWAIERRVTRYPDFAAADYAFGVGDGDIGGFKEGLDWREHGVKIIPTAGSGIFVKRFVDEHISDCRQTHPVVSRYSLRHHCKRHSAHSKFMRVGFSSGRLFAACSQSANSKQAHNKPFLKSRHESIPFGCPAPNSRAGQLVFARLIDFRIL